MQSDADEAALLATEAEGAPVAAGPVVVSGTTWVSYTDDTREPIRIAALDGVRLLITGSGTDDEFRTLAAAAAGGAGPALSALVGGAGRGSSACSSTAFTRSRAPASCSSQRRASASPRSHSATDSSRPSPPTSSARTTSASSSRACS